MKICVFEVFKDTRVVILSDVFAKLVKLAISFFFFHLDQTNEIENYAGCYAHSQSITPEIGISNCIKYLVEDADGIEGQAGENEGNRELP